ncbi:RNA polymerase I subunit [Heterostelium album PN500]|uniref:RNA polymerase I subunit n=1 Tax=Heterostelium pallidum (strain ATCC 26659 / Pp 5 / PN500) TaxID=670386 RepID=D3BLH5_HETP5|nr:RNA polymerase I subunit [Heterostelium album PN500]EFA77740.1 RNA polymerase I subunit [Heterostelium album PN500]|eukprot:XP_020429868.1 RNA polymerase I subunit [Heterostelium album PN500]
MEESQTSPFQIVTVRLKLMLAPINIGNIISGAKSALDRLIFRYNKHLKATIISYFNLKLVDKEVSNFYDSPFLNVPIIVSLMVFRPSKGQLIHGIVKRVSSTHLSLLVFGVISASIIKADLPKDLHYDHSSNTFVDKNNSANLISLGTKILFRVKDVLTDKNYITINGQMTDSDTYITGHEEIKVETPKKLNKNQQQQQKNVNNNSSDIVKFNDEEEETTAVSVEEPSSTKAEKKDSKKEKKVKSDSESESESESSESSESESESDEKSKKQKKNSNNKKEESKKKSKKEESSESESSESESSSDDKKKKKKQTTPKKKTKRKRDQRMKVAMKVAAVVKMRNQKRKERVINPDFSIFTN